MTINLKLNREDIFDLIYRVYGINLNDKEDVRIFREKDPEGVGPEVLDEIDVGNELIVRYKEGK